MCVQTNVREAFIIIIIRRDAHDAVRNPLVVNLREHEDVALWPSVAHNVVMLGRPGSAQVRTVLILVYTPGAGHVAPALIGGPQTVHGQIPGMSFHNGIWLCQSGTVLTFRCRKSVRMLRDSRSTTTSKTATSDIMNTATFAQIGA